MMLFEKYGQHPAAPTPMIRHDRAPGRGVGAAILSSVGCLGQAATVGRVTVGASLRGAMVSRLMYRARWTAHLMAWTAPRSASGRGRVRTFQTAGGELPL